MTEVDVIISGTKTWCVGPVIDNGEMITDSEPVPGEILFLFDSPSGESFACLYEEFPSDEDVIEFLTFFYGILFMSGKRVNEVRL